MPQHGGDEKDTFAQITGEDDKLDEDEYSMDMTQEDVETAPPSYANPVTQNAVLGDKASQSQQEETVTTEQPGQIPIEAGDEEDPLTLDL